MIALFGAVAKVGGKIQQMSTAAIIARGIQEHSAAVASFHTTNPGRMPLRD